MHGRSISFILAIDFIEIELKLSVVKEENEVYLMTLIILVVSLSFRWAI